MGILDSLDAYQVKAIPLRKRKLLPVRQGCGFDPACNARQFDGFLRFIENMEINDLPLACAGQGPGGFPRSAAGAINAFTIFIEPLSRLYLATAHGSVEELRGTLEGYSLLWRSLSSLFTLGDGAETRTGSSAQAHSKSADYP